MTEAAHPWRRRWSRVVATALAFPAVLALSRAAVTATGQTHFDLIGGGILFGPVAIYAAIAGRAWTLSLPLAWGTLLLGAVRLANVLSGSVCSEDNSCGTYSYFAFFAILPSTLAVLAGLLAGKLIRRLRPAR